MEATAQNSTCASKACKARAFEGSNPSATAKQITDAWSRATALGKVAAAYAAVGQPDQARELADQARNAAEQITDDRSRATALGHVAAGYAAADDRASARSQLARIWLLKRSTVSDWTLLMSLSPTTARDLQPYLIELC